MSERRPARCANRRCRTVYWAVPRGIRLEEDDVGDVLAPEDEDDDIGR